jgi:hypothetical protein
MTARVMALFVVPDVEREMNHLYRTTDLAGKVTSRHGIERNGKILRQT